MTEGSYIEVDGVSKYFGGVCAIDLEDMSVEFHSQYLNFCIIGANAAGKTTLFNLITGFDRPNKGRILYAGDDITGKPPQVIARRGIGRLFQDIHVFPKMTALDNVAVAAKYLAAENWWKAL